MKLAGFGSRLSADVLTIQVQGVQPERFASICAQQGIQLARMRPVPGGFTAQLPLREYRRLRIPARQCGVRAHIVHRRGLGLRLALLKKRPGLVMGLLIFAIIVYRADSLIWKVHFVDVSPQIETQLECELMENGLYAGAFVTQPMLEQTGRALAEKRADFGWVHLNFSGGRLVVEQLAASAAQTQSTPYEGPLIAAEDALILRTNVQSGFLQHAPGQTVAKGDVLVGTEQFDRFNNRVVRKTKGTVVGLVHKRYICSQPFTVRLLMPTGTLVQTRAYFFGPWKREIGKKPDHAVIAGQTQENLQLLGFELPVTVETCLYMRQEWQTVRYHSETAEQLARYACLKNLYEDFPDAVLTEQNFAYQHTESECSCTLTAEFEANIAVSSK